MAFLKQIFCKLPQSVANWNTLTPPGITRYCGLPLTMTNLVDKMQLAPLEPFLLSITLLKEKLDASITLHVWSIYSCFHFKRAVLPALNNPLILWPKCGKILRYPDHEVPGVMQVQEDGKHDWAHDRRYIPILGWDSMSHYSFVYRYLLKIKNLVLMLTSKRTIMSEWCEATGT